MSSWCNVALLIRTGHILLVLAIFSTLLYKDTELHGSLIGHNVGTLVIFTLVLAMSLSTYIAAAFMDPGYVAVSQKYVKGGDTDEEEEESSSSSNHCMIEIEGSKLRDCGFCGIKQPLRARHCEDCDRCVRKFDHHCPWLHNCVGERNHKFFLLFIVTTTFLVLWSLVLIWNTLKPGKIIQSPPISASEWFLSNLVLLLDLVVLVPAAFSTIGLSCMHLYLMVSGQSTWEYVSRDRITYLRNIDYSLNPFHEGYCKNMRIFLCSCKDRQWDKIYKRHLSV